MIRSGTFIISVVLVVPEEAINGIKVIVKIIIVCFFGLSFLLNNTDKIYAAKVNGVEPSTETIASGEYPVSRPLQFYVKNSHVSQVPGMKEYIEFFVSDEIAGPDGPLAEYGLVSDPELAATQALVEAIE